MENTDWIIQTLKDLADFASRSGLKESQNALLISAAIFEVELQELNKGKKLLDRNLFRSRFCELARSNNVVKLTEHRMQTGQSD